MEVCTISLGAQREQLILLAIRDKLGHLSWSLTEEEVFVLLAREGQAFQTERKLCTKA